MFPSAPVLDSGVGADEGPPPGAQWSGPLLNANTIQRVSNAFDAVPDSAADAYWNPRTFGPDCQVFARVVSDSGLISLFLRCSTPGAATLNGYRLATNSQFTSQFTSYAAGVPTAIGAGFDGRAVAAGDQIGFEAVGDVLNYYVNGVLIDTRTDSTYSGAGYIGIGLVSGTLDRFGGGDPSTYIGGTKPAVGLRGIVRMPGTNI